MNILIIGGLLALAVVAILGAVLLGISEDRADKKQQEENAASPMQVASTLPSTMSGALPSTMSGALPSTMSGTLPPTMSGALRSTRQLAPSLHEAGHISPYRSGQLPFPNEDARIAILSGQVYEIADDLYALAQKASGLEQRLNNIKEALEGLQYHQTNQQYHQADQQYHQDDTVAKYSTLRIDSSAF